MENAHLQWGTVVATVRALIEKGFNVVVQPSAQGKRYSKELANIINTVAADTSVLPQTALPQQKGFSETHISIG